MPNDTNGETYELEYKLDVKKLIRVIPRYIIEIVNSLNLTGKEEEILLRDLATIPILQANWRSGGFRSFKTL